MRRHGNTRDLTDGRLSYRAGCVQHMVLCHCPLQGPCLLHAGGAPASLACIAASVVYFTPVPSHLNVRLRDALMPIIHQLWYAARQYSIPDPQTKQKIWHRRGGRLILGIKHGQLCPMSYPP